MTHSVPAVPGEAGALSDSWYVELSVLRPTSIEITHFQAGREPRGGCNPAALGVRQATRALLAVCPLRSHTYGHQPEGNVFLPGLPRSSLPQREQPAPGVQSSRLLGSWDDVRRPVGSLRSSSASCAHAASGEVSHGARS
uniref:Uncharacterized protein n=1 Tax=Molossus molossus TaxID=27622 RepID=A0A7J8GQ75_MOLMO|nr:hypothetical protein HJG59_011320 [Molossus molossus]